MTNSPDDLLISVLAAPATVGLARTLTKGRLDKWGYSHISDDAFLVTSELITNAISATPGKQIRFQLSRDVGDVIIAIWDSSPGVPASNPPTNLTMDSLDLTPDRWDDNGGWGLHIVATLAINCGCTPDPTGGKWVWARLKP